MSSMEIVGLGALNTDYIYRVERIVDDGESIIREAMSFPGGSAANTICGLARLGVTTGFIGAIGDDIEGRALLQNLQSAGVDTGEIRKKTAARTGSVICLSDGSGKRSLYVLAAANSLLTTDDINLDYVNRANMLHLSSFADYFEFKLENLAPSLKLSFSPGAIYAAKGLEVLSPILRRTNILFLNRDELNQLTGQDIVTGAEICVRKGCQIVVVTLGRGIKLEPGRKTVQKTTDTTCYIRDATDEYFIESPNRETTLEIETIGAGDAFAAGFLYGFLNGKGLEECGRLGDIVAQFSITKVGARQGLPTLDELSQRYQQLSDKQL